AVPEIEQVGIIAIAALEIIVAGAPGELIVAVPAIQVVVPGTARNRVGSVVAVEDVVARRRDDRLLEEGFPVPDRIVGEANLIGAAIGTAQLISQGDAVGRAADGENDIAAVGLRDVDVRGKYPGAELNSIDVAIETPIVEGILATTEIEEIGVV